MVEPRGRKPASARPAIRVVAVLLLIPAISITAGMDGAQQHASRAGEFRVSYSSEIRPIVINRIHSWVLHVETSAGDAVTDARIAVTGGMPEHDHGLPTEPRVTGYLGEGNYLIEGLRFHMHGAWELLLTIEAGGGRDTVVIPLTL